VNSYQSGANRLTENKTQNKERIERMKNPKTTSVLVGVGLVLVLAYGYAQGSPGTHNSTNTFINNSGQAVGGLHIQYDKNAGSFFLYQHPFTFTSGVEDGSGGVTLSSGTVEAGGSIQISISSPVDAKPRVDSWWWTDGSGNLVGAKHRACTNPDCTSP
jgi:hypothetical protein